MFDLLKKLIKKVIIKYDLLIGLCVVIVTFAIGGGVTIYKLARYYIYDEKYDNQTGIYLDGKFENDLATVFWNKNSLININGAFRNVVGQHEMNGVLKLNNGYLTDPMEKSSDSYLKTCAENTYSLKQYLEKRDIKLLYMEPPWQVSKYDSQLPIGTSDYGNDNIDIFLDFLDEYQVDYIDIRERYYRKGIDSYAMRYKTDHHWNTRAGFYAANLITEYIVNAYSCTVDSQIFDEQNYDILTYKNTYTGSLGRRTGATFSGKDDFELFVPKFDTLLRQVDTDAIGRMEELEYDYDSLNDSGYMYDGVLGRSCLHYYNMNCDNDIKILIITDSYAKAVMPFLSMAFKETMYVYDQDVKKDFTPEIIESYNPTIVIMLYYPTRLKEGYNMTPYDFSKFID